MTDQDIVRHIDEGTCNFLSFFARGAHMEYVERERYSYIRPKPGERGVSFAYNIRLHGLPEDALSSLIAEISALDMPVWWGLGLPGSLYLHIHGKPKAEALADGDELYMAMTRPTELRREQTRHRARIERVRDVEQFGVWAALANSVLADGRPDIHARHHYHSCEAGSIVCYIAYFGEVPAAVASIMRNGEVCSLEFVATVPRFRRLGLARAVCAHALERAFVAGAKVITLRASNPGAKELYTSLGFRIYNHAV